MTVPTAQGHAAASGIARTHLESAATLRDRVDADIAAQRETLSTLTTQLIEAEQREENALAQYEDSPGPTAEELRASIIDVQRRIGRAQNARREADQRMAEERRRATAAHLASQSNEIEALRKRFRAGAEQLLAAFDALGAWSDSFEANGLLPVEQYELDQIAFLAPRCSIAELHAHTRNFLRTQSRHKK
jgi:hypothetical protein